MKVNITDPKDLTLKTYKYVILHYLLIFLITHSLTHLLFFAKYLEDLIAKNFEMEIIILDYLLGTM